MSWFYSLALWVQVGVGVVIIFFGGLQRADLTSITNHQVFPAGLIAYLRSLQENAWWSFPLLIFLSGVLGLLRKLLGSPWLWNTVHYHLDVIRETALNVAEGDALHHHRATLFKYVPVAWCRRKWPWDGWLVPVERSGYTTRGHVSIFRAPDDADRAEGVAGMAWARNQTVTISGLPALQADSDDADFDLYSRNSGVSVSWLRERLPQSRSFCGIPLEVKGKPWGVLVLDSRSPSGLREQGAVMYDPASRLLAKILERF